MLETSGDLLRVVIAFAILWIAIFTCWAIYYFAMILRNANIMLKSFNDKMALLDKILKLVHEKLESSAGHLGLIAESAMKLVGYMVEKNVGTKSKKKTTRQKK
ncbi:MAG: hypothetical protein COT81_00140 [Candidatus Buchananbacteria bacterium CG10_big_fil_rev_8_21_14_0_10_42_9]|uniref:Uncharacterized protein n=1 Tax=Candidatus Buchananbacteria bacterium CG10_big_fil_rev_8_21_14_0_10_42_9 TaxID=1974526 RepID=A0A2H0W4X5_9BACT|nr:MAG: hypothetical protein COT81_00140 [Candidatus Buchananbacteria bacterium CG10_big_fil_rev_8_21_14_0_10_42_9]